MELSDPYVNEPYNYDNNIDDPLIQTAIYESSQENKSKNDQGNSRDSYERYQNNYFRIYNENVELKSQLKELTEEIKKSKDELLDECSKKHYENYELKANFEKYKENLETFRTENE